LPLRRSAVSPLGGSVAPGATVVVASEAGWPPNDGAAKLVGCWANGALDGVATAVESTGAGVPTKAATAAPIKSVNGWISNSAGACSWGTNGVSEMSGWPGTAVTLREDAGGTACELTSPANPRGVKTPTSALTVSRMSKQTAATAKIRGSKRTTMLPASG
jgi:hypothetical protein